MRVVDKAIHTLLESNPFYAHFFLNSSVLYDKYNVPTAGAAMTDKGPLLLFNTKFLESLTPLEVGAVIEHEVLHLLFSHCQVMKKGDEAKKKLSRMENVAMDAAINQWIRNMPKNSISVEYLEELCKVPLERLQDWEYYFSHLKQALDSLPGDLEGHDDHGVEIPESEMGEPMSEIERSYRLKSLVAQAIKASRGNAPQHVLKLYDDMNAPAKVAWEQVLANFVARATSSASKGTRKKLHRRYGLAHPGRVKLRELTLGVCVDTSGSISDESYQAFMNEISRITKLCSAVHIVDADAVVQNVTKVKKGKKVARERHGAGGTAYQPAISECKRLKCDAIVYFGDMDSADQPENPGTPFLWVIVGEQEPPASFGGKVRLTC